MDIPALTPEKMEMIGHLRDMGIHIQDAAPFLNPDEREFLMTGITPDLWDKMFKVPVEE